MVTYLPRIVDGELERRLRSVGAVVIEGPKACGKTATATRIAQTVIRLDEDPAARNLIHNAPGQLFDNPTPILFDEWQVEPAIWNRVRRQVDDRQGKGLYILTGSATPNDDATRHSGAGRFGVINMRPMSLFESGHSNGGASLTALLEGEAQSGNGKHLDLMEVVKRIVIEPSPVRRRADARRGVRRPPASHAGPEPGPVRTRLRLGRVHREGRPRDRARHARSMRLLKFRRDSAGDPFEGQISHHRPTARFCVSAGQAG